MSANSYQLSRQKRRRSELRKIYRGRFFSLMEFSIARLDQVPLLDQRKSTQGFLASDIVKEESNQRATPDDEI